MKKLILPFVVLLIGMAACQKEDTNVLTLEVEHYNGDAKMHIDNQDFAVWDDGDIVWLNENEKQVSVNNTTHQATISASGLSAPYYASYPYKLEKSIFLTTTYKITLPAEQTYEEVGGRQKVAAPMLAYASNGDNSILKFHNIGSVLAVKVLNNTNFPLRVYSISVTANAQEGQADPNLWGTGNIIMMNPLGTTSISELKDLTNSDNNGNTVTLKCEGGVEVPAEGKVFYIALPTLIRARLTVKVDDGYGIYTLAQTNNTVIFNSNTLHQVPFSATEDICEEYSLRPNTIKYTATSQLSGFEEGNEAWGKTVVRHDYDATSQRGTITFNSDITSLPSSAFEGRGALLSIELPESVAAIRTDGFYECRNLYSVSMPGVTFVGQMAFGYCSALTTVNLPSVTNIADNAFCESGIQTITFGPDLSYLGLEIFARCCNINDIYCKAQSVPECEKTTTDNPSSFPHTQITDHTFNGMMCTPTLHVPSGMWRDYNNHAVWRLAFRDHIVEDCPTD